eukprot:TRINITY_DN8901_c0_g1_i1.p1 TRINITY_DN8901_c0_g1~~TRINITY_DN8901_c0_g1_i1.p1  ORF type:complete len:356 (+),score=91.44 TRINITY_DN8901_c0_g1_i1:129-1070(+)
MEQIKKILQESKTKDLSGHKQKVHTVAWSGDGKKLATGSTDQSIRVWLFDSVTKEIELKGHTDSVDYICWNPTNPNLLCSASADKTIRIWDCRVGKCLNIIPTPGQNLNIAWSPEGKYIAVGDKGDCVSLVDASKYVIVKNQQFKYEVNEIKWNNTGELFFATTGEGNVEIFQWKPNELTQVRVIHAHTATLICVEFDPLNRYFAVGSADSLVSLWDLKEMICLRTFGEFQFPLRTLSFSFDGQLLAMAGEDDFIDVASVETGEYIHRIPIPSAANAVKWNPTQMVLAYACDEKDHHGRGMKLVHLLGSPLPN